MLLRVVETDKFKDLRYFGVHTIPPNKVVYQLSGPVRSSPTRTSIQIGSEHHIEDEFGQFVNHNCHPSVRVVGNQLVSVREIQQNDSITFDYNATEHAMACPFQCSCCGQWISGAKNKA